MGIFFKHFSSYRPSPTLPNLLKVNLSPPPFLRFTFLNLKLSLFSTSIAADDNTPKNNLQAENKHNQQQNPITQFLLNECGLSQSQLSVVIRRRASLLKKRSIETPQQAVRFFRDSGFTEDQVRAIIVGDPSTLCLRVDRQLKPKLEMMKSLGFSGKHLAHICKASRFLGCNQKSLIPRVQYLQHLFASKATVTMALKRAPSLLLYTDFERMIKPNVDLLQQSGIEGELLLFLISRCPSILTDDTNSLKFKIEYVKNMGISQSSKTFAHALMVLKYNGPETCKNKLNYLASLGLLEHDIKELLRKWPTVLNISIDKMQKNMDFLIHTAGLPANFIVKYPVLLSCSLATRIKPRYAVFKFISEMQLYKPIPSLALIIQLTEQKFVDKYIKASPYATRLLDIYTGKSVYLNII